MRSFIFIISLLLISTLSYGQQQNIVNHNLQVKINPDNSSIIVRDSMVFSGDIKSEFQLNSNLVPIEIANGIKFTKVKDDTKAQDVGMDRDNLKGEQGIKLTTWMFDTKASYILLEYQGSVDSEIEQSKANYQRGFSESPGIINNIGVYLAGSTYWVPVFENSLMTFQLQTTLPIGWKNVTIGKRTFEKETSDKHIDTWRCDKPQEEVFLIAAKFTEYSHKMNNGIDAMAFLRTPDESLANKYLEVTEQYMEMYQTMLGDYPYTKFALVENFWETGYGMPSFTLLGEKIIRFPFILHSSYPHELLHNWWGNSVYVDFDKGNWCEGTTAFMADHLIKEQRGAGEEYRRSTLQKFSNLVNQENDFPLNKFISRQDGASEAIGYGKALMVWQMLRRKLGDDNFVKGMRLFYNDNKYRKASYGDIQKAMETVSGEDLSAFFNQWITRTGAPELEILDMKVDVYSGKYRINITLKQVQNSDAFNIDVPFNIATEKGLESFVFSMNSKEQSFQITLNAKPLKLAVDPQYDVFRILNPEEVPPTFNKIWGSKENIVILPSKASKEKLQMYNDFVKQWKEADVDNFKVMNDKDLKDIPSDVTVWILGYNNKFSDLVKNKLEAYNSSLSQDSTILDNNKMLRKGNDAIITLFNPKNVNQQIIYIDIDNAKAIEGLVRKLPHYGKYSYLAFNGDEPTNIAKGQWDVLNSPLIKIIDPSGAKAPLNEERKALAEFKPVFSANRMMSTINYLASEELKGRGLGTPEIDKAADYIASKFKEAGLQPLKDSYYQEFVHNFADKGDLKVVNVVGVIHGTDSALKDFPVVISAHYDHLGTGWPDVHHGDEGKIHYGADDNASGVSILVELAKTMAQSLKPKRTIVFLACSAEESGLIGSRYFVKHSGEYFSGKIFANVNLDTDGSLFDKNLLVLNANTAKEWKFIFMGTDYTTGVKSQVVEKQLDASDQMAFIEQEIPAVQLFTGATANYHKPNDTYNKIDEQGLVKVAIVTKEVVEYLADRDNAMPFVGGTQTPIENASVEKTSRRVSTGSVPDFAYEGEGVKIGSIIPGSVGDNAGLQIGDVILKLDNEPTPSLKVYSDLLKRHQPNDVIKLTVMRDGQTKTISLTLGER